MAKKKGEHCGYRNGDLFCFNCGESYKINYPQPVDMVVAISKQFVKSHKDCKPVWKVPVADMTTSVTERQLWWLKDGEHGLSSKAIFSVLSGREVNECKRTHPSDPDDFRRCYLLLKAVPEWREKLHEMKPVSPVWSKLVDNWDTLTEMIETAMASKENKATEMYKLMESIGC
jgi:uncharacterized protein YdcH (DUF465 family)